MNAKMCFINSQGSKRNILELERLFLKGNYTPFASPSGKSSDNDSVVYFYNVCTVTGEMGNKPTEQYPESEEPMALDPVSTEGELAVGNENSTEGQQRKRKLKKREYVLVHVRLLKLSTCSCTATNTSSSSGGIQQRKQKLQTCE